MEKVKCADNASSSMSNPVKNQRKAFQRKKYQRNYQNESCLCNGDLSDLMPAGQDPYVVVRWRS